jgi:hypothetical protein
MQSTGGPVTQLQKYILVASIGALTGIAARSYTDKPEIKEVIRVVEVKKETDIQTDRTTTIVKGPDGTETTTVVDKSRETTREESKDAARTVLARPRLNVAVLGGVGLSSGVPTFGAAITKEIAGPITAGVWGLNNGTVGVSIGINF